MKKLLFAVVVAACAASSAFAELRRHEAGAGEVIEIGSGAAKQDPGHTGSKFSCFYDIHDGGTLKWRVGEAGSTIWNQIVATNGLAILDMTAFPGVAPVFCAGIYTAGGKGWIRVKGKTTIYLGSPTSGLITESGLIDVRCVEFVDANDQPVSGGVAYYTANLAATVTNCSWSLTPEHYVRLINTTPVIEDDTFTSNCRGLLVGNTEAVREDQTFVINSGKSFGFYPGTAICDPNGEVLGNARPFGVLNGVDSVTNNLVVSCSVQLTGDAKFLLSNCVSKVSFGGTVTATATGTAFVDMNRQGDEFSGDIQVPLTVRTGSSVTLAGGASLSRFESEDETVTLHIGEGQATVTDAIGTFAVTGEGKEASTVDFAALSAGCSIVDDESATLLFGGASGLPTGALVSHVGGNRVISVSAAGEVSDLAWLPPSPTPYAPYEIQGTEAKFRNVPAGAILKAGAGTSAQILPRNDGGQTFTLKAAAGGTFSVGDPEAWKAEVSYWFDFSDTNTLRRIGEGRTDLYLNQNFIERCVDGRQPNATYSLWNRRLYADTGTLSYANSVYPIPQWNAKDGLTYLSMDAAGSSRRLPLSVGTGYNTFATLPVQLIVMVFGSQNGGGYAMVGTEGGVFGRTGTTYKNDAMTTNGDHDIWLDGVQVDPTTQKFNGGWQIVSIAMDGVGFRGLGFQTNLDGQRGGQNYGEVLVFTGEVSDLTRCEAEAYLANKWGITTFSDAALNAARAADETKTTVNASGDGTVRAVGTRTLELGGNFAGTFNLAGGKLLVKDAQVPYTPETLPRTDLEGWYDPDWRPKLWCRGDYDERKDELPTNNALRALYDRNNPEPKDGDGVVIGMGARMPYVVPQARGYGPVRNWVDFDNPDTNIGNNLRICAHDPSVDYKDVVIPMALKPASIGTGFVVVDSSRPVFTPIQTTVNGTEGDIYFRAKTCTTVWSPSTAAKVRTGETRLNGVTVDQTKGFNKCPEVLAFRPTENATAAFFGNFGDTENTNTTDYALLMGEVLLYSAKLTDADTQRIEGYLMRKWFGILPETCVDVSAATIAGTGTVEIPDFANVPKFDADFEGAVSVASGAATGVFEVTIDPETDTVTGALVAPNATVTLPADCTIRVTVTSKPRHPDRTDRSWTVFDSKALPEGLKWEFAGTIGEPKVKFVQVGNRIDVVSPTTGMTIIVK